MNRRRLGAEFGGTEKNFRGPNFQMTFLGRNSHFNAENIWRPIFLFIPYMTHYLAKTSISQQNIPSLHLVLVTSYFPAHPITLLLQILGGRMHGPSPSHLKFWGPSPRPSKSPPMAYWFTHVRTHSQILLLVNKHSLHDQIILTTSCFSISVETDYSAVT